MGYKIPFDEEYGLASYPGEYLGGNKWHYEEDMIEPFEFTSRLTFSHHERGRSSAIFVFRDELGRRMPFFMKNMADLIRSTNIIGGKVAGRFGFIKKGANYGVRYLGRA